jgi:hypothetical protein
VNPSGGAERADPVRAVVLELVALAAPTALAALVVLELVALAAPTAFAALVVLELVAPVASPPSCSSWSPCAPCSWARQDVDRTRLGRRGR